jgi:hypothetical protein
MARKVSEFTVDEQTAIAEVVIGKLVAEIHKDFITDPSGYNISKKRVGELSAKVIKNIKRGGLQPSKIVTKF